MPKSTFVVTAIATFALGYLQALTSQGGGNDHPGWLIMALMMMVGAFAADEIK